MGGANSEEQRWEQNAESLFSCENKIISSCFFVIYGRHQSFFGGGGTDTPYFGLLVTSALGAKARVDPLTCVLHW